MSYRTPIKKARGLGAAHHGTTHWWHQRLTSLALVPLLLWFVVGVATLSGGNYEAAAAWVGAPLNAVLLMLVVGVTFWHGALGLQVVIEDYVEHEAWRQALIVLEKFAAVVLGLAGIFAVLRVALGG